MAQKGNTTLIITIIISTIVVVGTATGTYFWIQKQKNESKKEVENLNKEIVELKQKDKNEEQKDTGIDTKENEDEKSIKTLLDNFVNTYKEESTKKNIFNYFTDPANNDELDEKTRWLTCKGLDGTMGGPCFGVTSGMSKTTGYSILETKKTISGYTLKVTETKNYYQAGSGDYKNTTRNAYFDIVNISGKWLINKYYQGKYPDETKYSGLSQ